MEHRRRSKSKPDGEPSAAARGLRLLARREHTRGELRRKLAPHVEDPAELEALLDDFTDRGWLSDERAVEHLVRAKRERMGGARIRQVLVERGVSESLIATTLGALKETELERARAVWTRKFPHAASDTAARARQVRFLQSRGFSLEIAMRVVRGGPDPGE